MDIGILASSTSSPSPLAVFPLDDPALDLSGIPFAGITASALSGDMAYFSIPERRWDNHSPVDGSTLDTPESVAFTPRAPFMSEQRPSPSPSDVGSMRLSRTRTRKRPRAFAEDDSENEFSRRPPSSELPLRNSASSSAVVPGTDQLAIPAAAQASSLSQLGLSNIYSTSGFDTLGILARLYMRPSPRVDLGPIDCSSSFIVVDAKDVNGDNPIIYVSENFTKLTGYGLHEVLGRNCRFLQAPDGIVRKGSIRKFVDNATILEIKNCVEQFQEASFTQINYKKGGTPFVNMITIVPLAWDSDEIKYFVGFQVDLEDQSRRILKRMFEGTYLFPGSRTRGRALEASTITELDAEDDQDKTERKSYTRQAKKRTKTGSRETVVSEQGSPAGAGAKLGLADFVSTALRPSLGVGTTLASPPTLSLAEIQQMADPETSLQNPSGLFKLEQASPYATFETFAPSPSEPSMMPSPSVAPSPAISLDAPMFVPIADDSETVELPEEEEEDDAVLDDEEIDEEDGDEDEDFFQPAKRSSKATASKGRRARASAIPQPTARNGRRPQGEQGDEIATGILSPRNLAENQSDFTFILSSRGIFLFGTAEGCMRTVGFDANDLVGRTLADLVHPHDVPSVARELRACRPGYPMTSVFRFRRNIGDDEQAYAWLEATGHKYELDNRKRTKCFVLSAREKVVDIVVPALYPESSALLDHITLIGGADSSLKWCKVTLEGLVLYSSKGLNELLDDTALYARKLWEVMDPASAESAREAFAEMKRAAKSGGHSMPRFAAKLKKGKGWIPTIVELHCVGTYPTNAVFAAIELLTDETKDLAEGSTQEASWSADAWPLLEVQNQSSLQHKQNWLRTQNRKLADSLMGLV